MKELREKSISQKKPTVVHIGVQKTGSSTIRDFLITRCSRCYHGDPYTSGQAATKGFSLEHFATLPAEERGQFDAISGHIHIDCCNYVPRSYVCITMLRDPLERFISGRHGHHVIRAIGNNIPTPSAIVENNIRQGEREGGRGKEGEGLRNEMLRALLRYTQATDDKELHKQHWSESRTAEMLKTAKSVLHDSFFLVGVTERIPEFMFLLQHRMGYALQHYKSTHRNPLYWQSLFNKTPNFYTRRIDPELAAAFREQNSADYAIYAYANYLFDQQLATLSRIEKQKLKRYCRMQSFYDPMKTIYNRIFRPGKRN